MILTISYCIYSLSTFFPMLSLCVFFFFLNMTNFTIINVKFTIRQNGVRKLEDELTIKKY